MPDHPVLSWARELAELHVRRLTTELAAVGDIDESRVELIRAVDRWIEMRLPAARGGAYLHTESLGAVVDRLAQLSACAYAAMVAEQEWDLWIAWERLAELAIGYDDLVSELSSGRRRLPSAF
ncbi:DUF4254 domain-containing protein [Nocardia sp. R7R-8]|uniref:DUF4254 domain-containing protein n=1 Tax=Nocardia sp. R7R-8 TaxID=3459304 RepID=UPI00403D85F8